MKYIYLDNAATSWPKPPQTIRAMAEYQENIGGSPGRSGHTLAIEAGRLVLEARMALADLFNVSAPVDIALMKNATEALNVATLCLLRPGDHVLTSGMEHNSVMRPLRYLEHTGVEVTQIPCSTRGELDPGDIAPHVKKNTRALYLTHASNVSGTIMPVKEAGEIARAHGLIFCVDVAQTAGAIPIDVMDMNIDLLAFTGHKSLFGPSGTGGLYVRRGLDPEISPLMMGGTGSRSEFEEQPDFMPDKFESGTPNTIGIAGLLAGVNFVQTEGVEAIRRKEETLVSAFIDGVRELSGVTVYGPENTGARTSVVSFNIEGVEPSEAALAFDDEFGIMTRPGLHCAPSAHRTLGTFPTGTNRMSFGYFNTDDDVATAIEAVHSISRVGKK
ncbi:MAG TPA: aminotransferase class V-fold PLP-dependent enzyme [Spirochaetota bacterium]|nr:aminotransferase class V-fold PLP-dependent enzyme [Spirochaetota bacterium]HPI88186.1 aminotransferase class V-fold PLP-dependent enzyme [Spirochaetota bacterium]HPR47961.1 aminotransferase class V-fold PLP-dependent enzyme [Spirochaetota bacterium]